VSPVPSLRSCAVLCCAMKYHGVLFGDQVSLPQKTQPRSNTPKLLAHRHRCTFPSAETSHLYVAMQHHQQRGILHCAMPCHKVLWCMLCSIRVLPIPLTPRHPTHLKCLRIANTAAFASFCCHCASSNHADICRSDAASPPSSTPSPSPATSSPNLSASSYSRGPAAAPCCSSEVPCAAAAAAPSAAAAVEEAPGVTRVLSCSRRRCCRCSRCMSRWCSLLCSSNMAALKCILQGGHNSGDYHHRAVTVTHCHICRI
jgi:hypothetical protein